MIMKLIRIFTHEREMQKKKSENFWKVSEKGDPKIHSTKSTEDQLDGEFAQGLFVFAYVCRMIDLLPYGKQIIRLTVEIEENDNFSK